MKPSKLQDHLRRYHPDKAEKDLKYFQSLKDKFQKRPTLDRRFASTSQRNDDGLRASYNISLLIAKSGKPHTIGEKLILPAVEEVLKTVLHKPASDIIKRIPLSNNTVERRIDEMSSDIESFLCNYLQTTHFSIQLDESTLPDNAALLLAYTSCQEDDVSTHVQHLNALYSDFESRFEDILTMVIPPWIINPYGDIEETNVIIQEELTELSTNEERKVPEDTIAQSPRKVRVTPIVLRDASRWRGVNHKFISLGIKFERAVAVDAGIRIIPKSEDDYRRIIRLFREEEVPHHTFPLPSERNIHAVIRGVHATLSEIEIKEELQQRGYSPLHIIRLKRGGGVPMPLVVVILPKIEKSQQLFNEHELLGLAIRVEVQKNSRLIGQCHRCQKYGHAQSYCTAPPKCLKCASDHMTHLCPQTEQEERKCANCGGGHPANSRTCRFAPKKNLQVIAQRRNVSYADAARDATRAAPSVGSSANTQNVDLATALRSLQQIIGPLISATQALQAIFPANG
ncbi:unnamed protein product [Acanthoscelides obtectus]|uniref:Pre-C2HC domain-containing protein n=1 Tax=Acanthoscelides obtectus TaxID=200917 RepID=A0A9P0M6Q4_ACAOB|nr:unnamed protein product [Acanthoscelides obtectus]CAK1626443.1 SCAN domain-containing protein 3 [Acanthoscelides obtectus]